MMARVMVEADGSIAHLFSAILALLVYGWWYWSTTKPGREKRGESSNPHHPFRL